MSTIDGSVCKHGWTTPPECPSCMAIELDALRDNNLTLNVVNERLSCEIGNLKIELDSLRQENSRLREALDHIAFWLENGDVHWPTAAKVATAALHSPINIDTLDP